MLRRARPTWKLVNLDALTYAGNVENVKDVGEDEHCAFVHGNVANAALVAGLFARYDFASVLHLAAESHVDRSIVGPQLFVETNICGTHTLLEAVRAHANVRFIQVSTDEVYGSAASGQCFTEATPLQPTNPYAASKAAADLLALAYQRTYGLDIVVTRCTNNFGPYQFPEKLIPLMCINALEDKQLPIYGDGAQERDWLHVEDHCSALLAILERGKSGSTYNIGTGQTCTNLTIATRILAHLGKPDSLIRHISDRPGHDRRYALDSARLRSELGWMPRYGLGDALTKTIDWYVENRGWWERVLSGAYRTAPANEFPSRA